MTGIETSPTKWHVEEARPEHISKILELFKSVFKHDISAAHWHWKYGDGRGGGVIVRDGDDIVSYFGGTERRVLFNGDEAIAFQSGDSMVAEQHRGTLSKKGPFFLSVSSFQDRYLGHGRPYLLSYGFPNERAMRLAERLGMYAEIGTMVDIAWRPKINAGFRAIPFDFDSKQHRNMLDELWRSMAVEFTNRAIGVRDLEYLRHRYHEHPALNYQLHLVYRDEDPMVSGLLVTRLTDDRLLLVDAVCPRQEFRHLVQFAQHLTSELNCRELYGWLTQVDCHLVEDTDAIISATPLRLPFGVYRQGMHPDEIRDKWFFLCGDSDFL